MTTPPRKQELASLLAPHGQEHLLRFWERLSPTEQSNFAEQLRGVDWAQVTGWVRQTTDDDAAALPFDQLKPAPYQSLTPTSEEERRTHAEAIQHGEYLLRQGRVAAFTVAGGQGTRLGYDGPKGTYPATPIRKKSLFQLFAEGIIRAQERYQVTIPWYIMTSLVNDRETRDFFQKNNYFGLKPANVTTIVQGMLPAFDDDGRALLAAPDSLAMSPNGHGGSFAALRDSGALDEMADHGITTISYWQVDNPLVKQFDPLFIGLHDLTGADISSRALIKRDAAEKLGHFCQLNNRLYIVEYSDMPSDMLQQKDSDGRLRFRAGSPAIHILERDFVQRLTDGALNFLPHCARKKVPFIDQDGNLVTPDEPNAVKIEFFLFDAIPLANHSLVLETDRSEQFAPIKNADGEDSPASSRAALAARTAAWFKQAGIPFPLDQDGQPAATVELSPRTLNSPEDLQAAARRLPIIQPGKDYYLE